MWWCERRCSLSPIHNTRGFSIEFAYSHRSQSIRIIKWTYLKYTNKKHIYTTALPLIHTIQLHLLTHTHNPLHIEHRIFDAINNNFSVFGEKRNEANENKLENSIEKSSDSLQLRRIARVVIQIAFRFECWEKRHDETNERKNSIERFHLYSFLNNSSTPIIIYLLFIQFNLLIIYFVKWRKTISIGNFYAKHTK